MSLPTPHPSTPKMTNVCIRLANPGDLDPIVRFNCALAAETEHRDLDRTTVERGVAAVLGDAALGRYYLAESGGGIVGQIMVTFEWSDWRNGTFWWIQSVYVTESWRARGVFRKLFEHVEAGSRDDPAVCGLRLYVDRDNRRAQAVYRRCGLEPTEYLLMETDRSGVLGRMRK
jgi:GNAT superfamily N-acetyltransferase